MDLISVILFGLLVFSSIGLVVLRNRLREIENGKVRRSMTLTTIFVGPTPAITDNA